MPRSGPAVRGGGGNESRQSLTIITAPSLMPFKALLAPPGAAPPPAPPDEEVPTPAVPSKMLATGSQSKVAASRASLEIATEHEGGAACKKAACAHAELSRSHRPTRACR